MVVEVAIVVATVIQPKWADCDDGNLAFSEGDDEQKDCLSEARLAYRLMIDAILAMVPTGKEMTVAEGGDAEISPSLEEKRGSLFRGWGQLLQLSMNL